MADDNVDSSPQLRQDLSPEHISSASLSFAPSSSTDPVDRRLSSPNTSSSTDSRPTSPSSSTDGESMVKRRTIWVHPPGKPEKAAIHTIQYPITLKNSSLIVSQLTRLTIESDNSVLASTWMDDADAIKLEELNLDYFIRKNKELIPNIIRLVINDMTLDTEMTIDILLELAQLAPTPDILGTWLDLLSEQKSMPFWIALESKLMSVSNQNFDICILRLITHEIFERIYTKKMALVQSTDISPNIILMIEKISDLANHKNKNQLSESMKDIVNHLIYSPMRCFEKIDAVLKAKRSYAILLREANILFSLEHLQNIFKIIAKERVARIFQLNTLDERIEKILNYGDADDFGKNASRRALQSIKFFIYIFTKKPDRIEHSIKVSIAMKFFKAIAAHGDTDIIEKKSITIVLSDAEQNILTTPFHYSALVTLYKEIAPYIKFTRAASGLHLEAESPRREASGALNSLNSLVAYFGRVPLPRAASVPLLGNNNSHISEETPRAGSDSDLKLTPIIIAPTPTNGY